MSTVTGLNILFWLLLWGTLIAFIKVRFSDSNGLLGSTARALAVIW